MAWLQKDPSGNYHISFRYGGRRFKRSLKTKLERVAETRRVRVEENIQLAESGRLELPNNADIPKFLLSDGKLLSKRSVIEQATIGVAFKKFFDCLPEGSLEETTVDCMKIHQRHLERHLRKTLKLCRITKETLQNYIAKRSKEKGRRGRKLSPNTIEKEIVTLRTIWNAQPEAAKLGQFPSSGLRYPKSVEKPPFQTREEIESKINSGSLTDVMQLDLWECLFLNSDELDDLLDQIRDHCSRPYIYPMAVMAAHTGARRSELLRSEILDFTGTTVTLRERKKVRGQHSTRTVPLSSRLKEAIEEWKQIRPDSPFTFCQRKVIRSKTNRGNIQQVTRNQVHKSLQSTLSKTDWPMITGWHCFRHSFCSNCAAQGLDERLIDSWVGHTTEEMRRRYRHLFPNSAKIAMQSVFG